MRVQRAYISGYTQVARVHLVALGIDPDAVKWQLRMTVPSQILEMTQIETLGARADLASRVEPYWTKRQILTRVFHMTDAEAEQTIRDRRSESRAEQMGDAQNQDDIARTFPMAEPPEEGEGPQPPPPPIPQQAPESAGEVEMDRALRRALRTSPELRRTSELLEDANRQLDAMRPLVKDVRTILRLSAKRGT
jgi:hypothetical protein